MKRARRLLVAALCLTATVPGLEATHASGDESASVPLSALQRVAGADRIETAVAVSRLAFPDGAGTVVLARADAYADALAGAPLAALRQAPLLLTATDTLPPVVVDEIRRLGADRGVVLGGTAAIGPGVEAELAAAGIDHVERLAGNDRWATAATIADEVARVGSAIGDVYVVEGADPDPTRGWPDAVAASAAAAGAHVPLLLVDTDTLPEPTRRALQRLAPRRITVVGGTAAVGGAVADQLAEVADTDRIAGADRYATSAELATHVVDHRIANPSTVWLASGANWPDALVTAPAAARHGAPLLLVPPSGAGATEQWLSNRGPDLRALLVAGGESVVTAAATDRLTGLLPDRTAFARWSDPATWGGRPPAAGDDVTIPAGQHVLLDVSPAPIRTLTVHGHLELDRRDGLRLTAQAIRVHGTLAAGATGHPHRHSAEIVLDPSGPHDDHVGTGALAVPGGTLALHGGVPGRSWTDLAAPATPGASSIRVQDPAAFDVGDQIVIAATGLDPSQAELRRVTAVADATLAVDEPLAHRHAAQVERVGDHTVPRVAQVGRLSRPLVVRGVAPDRQGHVMAMAADHDHGSTVGTAPLVQVSGVEFRWLGQPGQLGRYPVHFHMAGHLPGSFVASSSIHASGNRCITIHGSHDLVVRDVVAHDTVGHCLFFEDGVETGVTIDRTLALSTWPAGDTALLPTDHTPATFWLQHPRNSIRGSVAGGGRGMGFWYDLPEHPTGLSATAAVTPRTAPLGAFVDNVAHSYARVGDQFHTGIGLFTEAYTPAETATFEDFVGHDNGVFGAWLEHGSQVLDGAALAGNHVGVTAQGATVVDSVVVGTTTHAEDQPWQTIGAGLYTRGATYQDVTFADLRSEGTRHATPVSTLAMTSVSLSEFQDITLLDSDPIRLRRVGRENERNSQGLRDLDGSLVGRPASVLTDEPLLTNDGCTEDATRQAELCGVDLPVGLLRVDDLATWTRPAGTLSRDDGRSGPLLADPRANRRHQSLLLGHAYRLGFLLTPPHLGIQLGGVDAGHIHLTLPWPYGTPEVYLGPTATSPQARQVGGLPTEPDQFRYEGGDVTLLVEVTPDASPAEHFTRLRVCSPAACSH